MVPVRAAVLLSLLALAAGLPAQQPPAAAGQLADMLGPAMEATVARALSSWQPPALSDLSRLLARLDAVERDLDDLRLTSAAGGSYLPWAPPLVHRAHQLLNPPEPQPRCDVHPSPLPADQAPHQKPAVTACAKTCRQLRDQGGSLQDGVYWLAGLPVPVFCDFSHDGGGWTLLLTAATRDGWDPLSVLGRNEHSPSITDNYSILQHADAIRKLATCNRFAYRIETQAEKGRGLWGGVWTAPRDYSFVAQSLAQTDVSVVRKFDNWDYSDSGIEKRMPWLNTGNGHAVLTTSTSPDSDWWGTLVTRQTTTVFHHSPWISGAAPQSGTVLYWVRE